MSPPRTDRRQPAFRLDRFQQVFSGCDHIITKQAQSDLLRLGLDLEDLEQVIRDLRPEHFYKSMPATRIPGVWQDVYRTTYMRIPLYLKIQLRESGEPTQAVVIAFKEDEADPCADE